MDKIERIGLIGYGTVGKALHSQIQKLSNFSIEKIAIKHPEKHLNLDTQLLTKNAMAVIEDDKVSIILEAIDDSEAAQHFAIATLKRGKTYITASKKMVAGNLDLLLHTEQKYGGTLLFEAAVGGAIPIIRTIREHLSVEPISKVRGILNGSTNYILTQMAKSNISFEKALEDAQKLGYAESNPASDIDGTDSFYKSILIAGAVFGGNPIRRRVVIEGIRQVSLEGIEQVKGEGKKIKLVTSIMRQGDKFDIDSRPVILDPSDPLYPVDGVLNAVEICGEHTGSLILQGSGAGGAATASAMVGDLVNVQNEYAKKVRKLIFSLA